MVAKSIRELDTRDWVMEFPLRRDAATVAVECMLRGVIIAGAKSDKILVDSDFL